MEGAELIHLWSRCHHCEMSPIRGSRFHCRTCASNPDCDLCASCYEQYRLGRIVHPASSATAHEPPPATSTTTPHQFEAIQGTPASRYSSWLESNGQKQPPPPVPTGFAVRPEFRFSGTSAFGAYGFAIRFGSGCLLLTALHVLDEVCRASGIDASANNPGYRGDELPRVVTSVGLYDVLQPRWMLHPLGDAGQMLVLPNARAGDEEPFSSRDIAAFRIDSVGQLTPGRLAEHEPQPGDSVWLVAAMSNGGRTRHARVVERPQSPASFVFRYEEPGPMPKFTSGSAIVDRNGDVVGINVGFGKFAGREFGHANPLASIRAHLEHAR